MVTLEDVKKALNLQGNDYQNDTLQVWMDEVMEFIRDAGVKDSRITAGLVARGVADLWNYGAGDGKLSTYFMERVAQLSY